MKEIDKAIHKTDRRRHKHKWVSVLVRLLGITFTALIPVLLGWSPSANAELRNNLANAAMILSAMATVLSAWEAFYGNRELWAVNTTAFTKLCRLKNELEYLMTDSQDHVSEENLDRFYQRFLDILAEADDAWVGLRWAAAKQASPVPHNEALRAGRRSSS